MTGRLNPKKINTLLLVGLVASFCIFVVFWEKHKLASDQESLRNNARVIASDMWNLDPFSPVPYLELAAKHYPLDRITVLTVSNRVFMTVDGPPSGIFDKALESIGLIPRINLQADIIYRDNIIGKIVAIHRHTTIYLYFYLLTIMGFILLVARLYVRTLEAKNILEDRVAERTQELVATNNGLKQEVHDRTMAETALRESEEKYRQIFNAPSDAILMHDAETGAILDVNRAALELYEYPRDALLKQDIGSLSSGEAPYDMEHSAQKVLLALTQGAQLFEWQVKKKSGEIIWVEVALRYTEINDIKYVIAVVRDIDKRKKAENALAAEQERLAVTLRSIGDGVITTDINGKIVLLNKIAEQLTGWSHKEAAGKPLTEVFNIINEKTGNRCDNPVEKVLATGHIIALANHTALIAKDGSKCSIADSGAPIMDENSEIIGVVLVFRDVTVETRKEEELAKARKLESVGLLAGGIAHDFNNILAAILGNINLALLDCKPEDKTYSLLQEAEKASLRAKDLTRQLLTFAKGGEPVKELAHIKEVIQDSANFVLRGSNVRCNFHCESNLWPVEVDQGQMSQVIQNIIINANQAMPEGGVIEVCCTNIDHQKSLAFTHNPADYIEITIRDTGIGMASSLLDKIFDPYFTTKQEGSGLGLAVSHSIINKHDGYMTVTSELGEGTIFTIYLPAEKDKQIAVSGENAVADEVHAHGKIMVMDDEEMLRSISKKMLIRLGYEVLLAKDGEEAIAMFNEARQSNAPIDLIIMDLTIPGGMGGEEAVQKIHKIDPTAKIIVSSGYSNDPIMANYQEYGFLATIIKPFQFQEIKSTIRQVL